MSKHLSLLVILTALTGGALSTRAQNLPLRVDVETALNIAVVGQIHVDSTARMNYLGAVSAHADTTTIGGGVLIIWLINPNTLGQLTFSAVAGTQFNPGGTYVVPLALLGGFGPLLSRFDVSQSTATAIVTVGALDSVGGIASVTIQITGNMVLGPG